MISGGPVESVDILFASKLKVNQLKNLIAKLIQSVIKGSLWIVSQNFRVTPTVEF